MSLTCEIYHYQVKLIIIDDKRDCQHRVAIQAGVSARSLIIRREIVLLPPEQDGIPLGSFRKGKYRLD